MSRLNRPSAVTEAERRPQGRPLGWRKPADVVYGEVVRARVSAGQAAEWGLLGGAEWLRAMLDRAARKRAKSR